MSSARWYCAGRGVQDSDAGDMAQEAALAAWQAWGRFDATRGTNFRQYAWKRVRGAIVRTIERARGRPGSARRLAKHVSIDDAGQIEG